MIGSRTFRGAPANGNVSELFCRTISSGSAADMRFERGLLVDHMTGWEMDVEEPVSFSDIVRFVMLMRDANGESEVRYETLVDDA